MGCGSRVSADSGEKHPGSLKLGSEHNVELVSGFLGHKGTHHIISFVKHK